MIPCTTPDCDAIARWISTSGATPISPLMPNGTQAFQVTRTYRCTNMHTLKIQGQELRQMV